MLTKSSSPLNENHYPVTLVSAEEAELLASMSTKEVFGWTMGKLALTDNLLTVAVADYGRRLNLDRFHELCPDGFIQCGIAEQNLIEVASACANEGFHVFAPCYATFVTSRTLDQIRVNLGMMRSAVVLVGVAAGCESAATGPSHMAVEDIAVTRTIPGLSVFTPCDNAQLAAILMELSHHPKPAYVRMTSCDNVNLHPHGFTFDASGIEKLFEFSNGTAAGHKSKDTSLRKRITVFSTGAITSRVVEAAKDIAVKRDCLNQQFSGRLCSAQLDVYGVSCVKPLDDSLVEICQDSDAIITVEEHSILGGFGSAIIEQLSNLSTCPQVIRLGMPDSYLEADTHHNVLKRVGLTISSIKKVMLEVLSN